MLKTFKQMKALYNFPKYLVHNFSRTLKIVSSKIKKANSGSHLKFICQLLFKKRRLHLMQIVSQDVITKGGNIIVTIFSSKCRIFG